MSIEYDQDSFLAGLAFARNVVGWVGGRGESWINESTVTTFNGVLIGANGYVTAKPLRDIVDISYDDPVTSRAVASALVLKQDALTFDQTPQAGSSNPVYSNGIAVQLNLKAPLESPSFSGTPHAPTPVAGASNTQIATTEFVMKAIASGGGGGTEVIANPTGTATDTLNTIQIEQVIYNIAGGSGSGTEVIANPTAEATDTLNKLQVGQIVYSIAGGGGGVDYLTVVDGKICVIYEVT